jgi:site-specific DNA-cytosine methylase
MTNLFGIDVEFRTVWLAEKDPRKIAFLAQQSNPPLLVGDFLSMNTHIAKDIRSGLEVVVPETDLLVGGFPCVQKSSLNPQSHLHRHCVQDEDGQTGLGFKAIKQFVAAHRPSLVILENVKVDVEGDNSETEYMKKVMREMGYAFHMIRFDARAYGSWVVRDRTYFVGWLGGHPHEACLISCTLIVVLFARWLEWERISFNHVHDY